MIQNRRVLTGIKDSLNNIRFKDGTPLSNDYFRVFDMPEKFYAGKNSFRIRANNNNLVRGSNIYIDIVDGNGDPIYYEVLDAVPSDDSRVVVVYIYGDTPQGSMDIYIAGRAKISPKNGSELPYSNNEGDNKYKNNPNIYWTKRTVTVPNEANRDEILFSKRPEIEYFERKALYKKVSGSSDRLEYVSGSGNQTVELQSSIAQLQTTSPTFVSDGGSTTIFDPEVDGDKLISKQEEGDDFYEVPTIKSNGFEFSKEMAGGKIFVGVGDGYQARIVSVIDKYTAEVDRLFNSGGFEAQSNFTASYWATTDQLDTVASESFLQLNIRGMEPDAGVVDKIDVSYKPYGTFGDFIDVGSIKIEEQNILTIPDEYDINKFGVTEKAIGSLEQGTDYLNYWNFNEYSGSGFDIVVGNPSIFDSGVNVSFSGSLVNLEAPYIGSFQLDNTYAIDGLKDTEYKLEFSSRYNKEESDGDGYKQIDIYISGSNVDRNDVEIPHLMNVELESETFGYYIGSINTSVGSTFIKNSIYFKTIDDNDFIVSFVIRNGTNWDFKDIAVYPRFETGFSPNRHSFFVPIQSLKKNNELVINVEYGNKSGVVSGVSNTLIGLYFSGSENNVNEIVDQEYVEEIVANYISGSGSMGSDYFPKQILFPDADGEVSQSSLLKFDYDTDELQVGDTTIGTSSIGFETRRLIIKRGDNEDIVVTGSINVDSDGDTDMVNFTSASQSKVKIDKNGLFSLGEMQETPTAITGGFMYSGSGFWVGV